MSTVTYERDTDAQEETDGLQFCLRPIPIADTASTSTVDHVTRKTTGEETPTSSITTAAATTATAVTATAAAAAAATIPVPPPGTRQFALAYNQAIFDGWVKQSSPACAAASVAGAINALLQRRRGQDDALDQAALVSVLRGVLEDRMETQRYRLECCLGADFGPIETALKSSLAGADPALSLGMKWEKGTKRKTLWQHLRKIVTEHTVSAEDDGQERGVVAEEPAAAAKGVDSIERLRLAFEQSAAAKAVGRTEEEEEEEGEEESGGEGSGDDVSSRRVHPQSAAAAGASASTTTSTTTTTATTTISSTTTTTTTTTLTTTANDPCETPLTTGPPPVGAGWRKCINTYLNTLCGYERLGRERPSTGFFGNWGIAAAVKRVARENGLPVTSGLFMGRAAKGTSIEVKLGPRDSPETIDQQWAKLRDAFMMPNRVLIFHLKSESTQGKRGKRKEGIVALKKHSWITKGLRRCLHLLARQRYF